MTSFTIGNAEAWVARAGCHSNNKVPEDLHERLAFALLEAIDFNCWEYGDAPDDGMTIEDAKQWLYKNKELANRCPPPSFLGLIGSKFDFLNAEE
jgi:hypothetical protein